jgi:flagellar capping protein FliD
MRTGELAFYKALREKGHSEGEALEEVNMMVKTIPSFEDKEVTTKDIKIALLEMEMETHHKFNELMDKIDNKFNLLIEKFDERFDKIDERFKEERKYNDAKFDKIDERFNSLDSKIHKIDVHLKLGYILFAGLFASASFLFKMLVDLKYSLPHL